MVPRVRPTSGPVVAVVLLLSSLTAVTAASARPNRCRLVESLKAEIASYRPVVDSVLSYVRDAAGYKGRTWTELANFTDAFGYRLAGTKNLEASVDYVLEKLRAEHLENVHTERVQFTGWRRYCTDRDLFDLAV
jgi:carboxypeptidase Q